MHLHSEAKAKKAADSTNLLVLIRHAKSVEIETWHYGTIGILWPKHFAVRNVMKILSAVICFSVLCLTFYASAADDPVNFSGTWVLDSKESDPFPRPVMSLGAEPGRGGGGMPGGPGGMGGPPGGGGIWRPGWQRTRRPARSTQRTASLGHKTD